MLRCHTDRQWRERSSICNDSIAQSDHFKTGRSQQAGWNRQVATPPIPNL
jgi:hypothetical protein